MRANVVLPLAGLAGELASFCSWTSPFPRIGAKRRDADEVAAWLRGMGIDDRLRLVVADSDRAIRALWMAAHAGRLGEAAGRALGYWHALLANSDGDVRAAWNRLRRLEDAAADTSSVAHAAWAIAVGAGTQRGGSRRNKAGWFNWPYSPGYEPDFLPSRIAAQEVLVRCDAWAKGRVHAVLDDFRLAVDAALVAALRGERVALLADPPYGAKKEQVYDGKWRDADDEALRHAVVAALTVARRRGKALAVVVWCGVETADAWRAATNGLGVEWRFRAAGTAMTAGADGRKAEGGWIGRTT